MSHRVLALSLLLLVVLAGCLGPAFGADGGSRADDRPSSGSSPPSVTAGDSGAGTDPTTETATPAAPDGNPWGTDPVVVAVEGPPGRDVVPLVRAATAYWERNATRYAGYAVDYEVRPDAPNPDLVVSFRDEITGCERTDHTAGCAPYITRAGQIDRPVTIEIKTGLSDASTVQVVTHELGHTLGLGHDDEPQSVMRTGVTLTTLPQPNATERAFPWADAEFTVFVDVDDAPDPDAARQQVYRALGYYKRGAPGMPDNLTFEVVDDPDADLVVRYADSSPCTEGSGSCGSSRGPDPDGDGASERYSQFTVTLVGIDTAALGWHTGYWLAVAFGTESDDEKPPPFRDAPYDERRGEWWE
jgi:hypothetical protein